MEHNKPKQTVTITGMGIISSVGQGVPVFRDALFQGYNHFTRSLNYPMLSFPVLGAFISDFNFSLALKTFSNLSDHRRQQLEKISRQVPKQIQLAIIAALETWQQAGLDQTPIGDASRVGLVVAGENTTGHYEYDLYATFQQQPDYLSPSYALHFMDTDHIGVLSEVFGILGEGFTVGGASATGNVALIRGYQLLRDNWQDACLVIGALADLSPMELQGFHNIGALGGHHFTEEPNKACRPFDKAHEGFIYGQAVGCLLLETVASAIKRKAPILGYFLGGALLLDGNRLSNSARQGEIRVMQQAIKVADITIEEIDYINTHGTSAPQGDQTEIEAIESLFAKNPNVIINSTKSIIGHCLWSAGIVEAIATLIQMQEGFVHPTLNLDNPISDKSRFIRKKSQLFQMNTALSNSFGFGGINTAIVLSRAPTQKNH
jgi:malonyl-ACP decarboxylase